MRDKSKSKFIADHYRALIYSGEMSTGESFPTRKQLCDMYKISPMTAFQVQRILQEAGLISNVRGVGFFVNRAEMYQVNHPDSPVRKIRMVGSPQALDQGFGLELVAGVRKACEDHSLELNMEMVQVLNNPPHFINTSRRLDDDEALLVFLHDELLPEIVHLLLSPDIRAVTVGRSFPDKPAVLHDYRHVTEEILRFCARKNFRNLLYVGQCSHWTILNHESELFEAFEPLARNYQFAYRTNLSGHFPSIEKDIKDYRPDAVVFSHDQGALRIRDHYFADGESHPPFIGFGDILPLEGKPKLRYTYRTNAGEMGRRAVEILLRPNLCVHPPLHERVQGWFVERSEIHSPQI